MNTPGAFVEIYDEEMGLITDNLYWYGHVESDELDWIHVQDLCQPDEYVVKPEDYGTPHHCYGRWVPGSCYSPWDMMWKGPQFHSERGAFPVTRVVSSYLYKKRRWKRRATKGLERMAKRRFPDATKVSAFPSKTHESVVHIYIPGEYRGMSYYPKTEEMSRGLTDYYKPVD